MIDEKSRLLEQAERCRQIARSANDSETVAMLVALARSYEAKAARLSIWETILHSGHDVTDINADSRTKIAGEDDASILFDAMLRYGMSAMTLAQTLTLFGVAIVWSSMAPTLR